MAEKPKLRLVSNDNTEKKTEEERRVSNVKALIEKSLAQEEQAVINGVDDLALERIRRNKVPAAEVTPRQLLTILLDDIERMENDGEKVDKCYVTLIRDGGENVIVTSYRAGLSRPEELAYRQLGVQETLDSWRFGEDV